MSNLIEIDQPVQAIPTVSVVMEAGASLQLWADRIRLAYERSVGAIIATGKNLNNAKASVPHGGWGRMFRGHPQAVERPIPFSQDTAERLMAIARNPVLSNSAQWAELPNSWRTLFELSKIEASTLESYLSRGMIHADMTRQEALQLTVKRRESEIPSCRVQSMDEEVFYLEVSESRNNSWAAEVNSELNAPLQFSVDGRIVSGVFWLPEIPVSAKAKSKAAAPTHRCVCQVCGHSHEARA